jgi:hypothetical protein
MANCRFREVQRFSPLLLGALAVGLAGLGAALWRGAVDRTAVAVGIGLVAAAVVVVLYLGMPLVTEVRGQCLCVRLVPFPARRIALHDIREVWVRTYRPLLEYGGWGIRFGRQGMAYNARGNRGVQLLLADGRKVLIGSQRPEALLAAIEQSR